MINLDNIAFKETPIDGIRSEITASITIHASLLIDRRSPTPEDVVRRQMKRTIWWSLYGDLRKLMPEILSITYEVTNPIHPGSKALYEKLEEIVEKLKVP